MSHTRYAALRSTQTRYVAPDTHIGAHEVRSFCLEVLGRIEVRPPDGVRPDDARYFLAEQQLIEVRAPRDHDHVALERTVDSPLNVAEPCGRLIAVLPRKGDAGCADIQL